MQLKLTELKTKDVAIFNHDLVAVRRDKNGKLDKNITDIIISNPNDGYKKILKLQKESKMIGGVLKYGISVYYLGHIPMNENDGEIFMAKFNEKSAEDVLKKINIALTDKKILVQFLHRSGVWSIKAFDRKDVVHAKKYVKLRNKPPVAVNTVKIIEHSEEDNSI